MSEGLKKQFLGACEALWDSREKNGWSEGCSAVHIGHFTPTPHFLVIGSGGVLESVIIREFIASEDFKKATAEANAAVPPLSPEEFEKYKKSLLAEIGGEELVQTVKGLKDGNKDE